MFSKLVIHEPSVTKQHKVESNSQMFLIKDSVLFCFMSLGLLSAVA